MKQKHFLISLAVLAIGISVDAQTKDNVKTTFQTSRSFQDFTRSSKDSLRDLSEGFPPTPYTITASALLSIEGFHSREV